MPVVRALGLAVVLAVLATTALAEGPRSSLRPRANPFVIAGVAVPVAAPVQALTDAAPGPAVLRPRPRPAGLIAPPVDIAAAPVPVPVAAPAPRGLLGGLLKPRARPEGLSADRGGARVVKTAIRSKPSKAAVASRKGSVCGDAAIKGEVLSPVTARVKGCGIVEPVRVTSVSGVRLSQPATIDCPTAQALKKWVDAGLQPALGRKQKVVELKIAAHYICRPRNNQRGNKISEHGRGKAIDIAGFVLADGTEWSVAGNYNKTVRKAHKAACGIFGTTLGPGSDGFHEDHLHFDTARHGNGAYCR